MNLTRVSEFTTLGWGIIITLYVRRIEKHRVFESLFNMSREVGNQKIKKKKENSNYLYIINN